MNEMKSVAVVIVGRVQGVGYRAWTQGEAQGRGLAGHVRNRSDGAVEAVFAGPAAAVDAMVQACRAGPPGARVERIDIAATAAEGGGAGFTILG